MAQLHRVEGQTELKCDADKFFDVWTCKPYLILKMFPNKITNVELLQGDQWQKLGALQKWSYVCNECGIGESIFSLTIRYDELDVEKRVLRYGYHDGFIVKNYYKTFKSKMEVTPKNETQAQGGGGCIVKWSIEYEKMNEAAPEPKKYVDYLLDLANGVDAYFLCNTNA